MTNKPQVLVLSMTNHATDPRVQRQIEFLRSDFDVVCAGTGPPDFEDVSFIPLSWKPWSRWSRPFHWGRLLMRRESYYWAQPTIRHCLRQLDGTRADLIIANDLEMLPAALRIARGVPVILDAHEYSPREVEDRLLFRLLHGPFLTKLCRKYLPDAAAAFTVSESIAEQYFAISNVRPVVLTNAPFHEDLWPTQTNPDGTIRIIHHGAAHSSRKIELMIDLMDHLDERFRLDLMLVECTPGYLTWLKRYARNRPRLGFRDPVPMPQINSTINEYDIGLFLLPPTNFNYRCALPNKFFEFVQSRLAVAIGPSPEMARLVRQHDLGIISDDFTPQSLAHRLNVLDDQEIARYKSNAHRAARALSAERNRELFLSVVDSVLSRTMEPTCSQDAA